MTEPCVALITGIRSPAGASLARNLKDQGWEVYGVSRSEAEFADAQILRADLTSEDDTRAVGEELVHRLQGRGLHLFAHLAGKLWRDSISSDVPLAWAHARGMYDLHVSAPSLLALTLRSSLAAGNGLIVLVSSTSAVRATPHQTAYGATKAGTENLVLSLANSLGRSGIRVLGVRPGAFQGGMSRDLFASQVEVDQLSSSTPLGRLGTSLEVAEFIADLALSPKRWYTGDIITLDGGSLAGW